MFVVFGLLFCCLLVICWFLIGLIVSFAYVVRFIIAKFGVTICLVCLDCFDSCCRIVLVLGCTYLICSGLLVLDLLLVLNAINLVDLGL